MNEFNIVNKKSISKYLHLHKISDFEETSQRNNYLRNWRYYAEDHCCTVKLSLYKKY